MDELKDLFYRIAEIENIKEIRIKEIEINPDKVIYFAFKESQKIVRGQVTSGSIKPIGFILKMGGEYYYCPLDKKEMNKKVIRKFCEEFI